MSNIGTIDFALDISIENISVSPGLRPTLILSHILSGTKVGALEEYVINLELLQGQNIVRE